jgi:hypothetical protein
VPCDKGYSGETAMANGCRAGLPAVYHDIPISLLTGEARDEHSRGHRGSGANILEFTR